MREEKKKQRREKQLRKNNNNNCLMFCIHKTSNELISVCMGWSKLILSQYHPVHSSRVKRTNDVQNCGRQTKAYEREVHKIAMKKIHEPSRREHSTEHKAFKMLRILLCRFLRKEKKYIKKEEVTRILTWILILIQNDLISYHRCNTCASFIAVA